MNVQMSSIFLAAAPLQPRPFDINPAISPWMLFVGAVIAAVAVLYLYNAQQKIAARGIVNSLMGIRVLLVLLVIALLLGPVRQWAHTRHSSGTLYVLLDQTLSMRQKDPQSTDAELLAWASALGYLPAELRPPMTTVDTNRLVALRDDLDHFHADAGHLMGDANDSNSRQLLAANLDRWDKQLVGVAGDLNGDAQIKLLAADVPGALQNTAETVGNSIVSIQADDAAHRAPRLWLKIAGAILAVSALVYFVTWRKRFSSPLLVRALPAICMALALVGLSLFSWAAVQWPEATELAAQANEKVLVIGDKTELPWQSIHDMLGKSIAQIAPIAAAEDNDFLARHGSDPRVQDAIGRVRHMDRAELAYAALTAKGLAGSFWRSQLDHHARQTRSVCSDSQRAAGGRWPEHGYCQRAQICV
jgi:hypothetical protein